MYNCKDEHLASISLSGDLILHSLASGARATELKDPHEQVLRVLDYSRVSRHLLVTAGDDGSVHLFVYWLNQHSAPTVGIGFSPSNDKIIASVGLDKKLYTYETPFSSLAFRDDGLVLAAGTSSGRVVFYDVRGKPQPFTVLRAYGSSEDEMEVFSPLVDVQPITPLLDKFWDDHEGLKKGNPSVEKKPSSLLFPSSSRRFPFQKDGTNGSPIFDWKSSSTSRQNDALSFTLPGGSTPSSSSKSDNSSITPPDAWGDERLSDKTANLHQPLNLPSRFAMTSGSSALGSMFSGLQDLPSSTSQTGTGSLTNSSCSFSDLHTIDVSLNQVTSMGFPELISSSSMPLSSGTKGIMGLASLEVSGPASLNQPRRFSSYAERISTTASFSDGASLSLVSPKTKKTRFETREELLNSILSRSDALAVTTEPGILPGINVAYHDRCLQYCGLNYKHGPEELQPHQAHQRDTQQGSSFTLQLFQRTLDSFQKSIHGDMRSLHIEVLRQFHMQEMGLSGVMNSILENQAELMKELSLPGKKTELRKML
ncbi:hypothetical protein DKX38_016293 [Salix brachista]|uniref:Uncharacterized protein n=1 Tax=Salix brachista TaxID=2182728 RepID=A0A5N5L857_9ROSI|nr:hypothetical protein DKX38_016293 [Salix brachista]